MPPLADGEGRLHRQVVALEDDGVTPTARKHIAARIAEPEQEITDRQARLDALTTEQPAPPDPDSFAAALDRLPILGSRLHTLPASQLRALLDSLQLTVTYHPDDHAADVTIALPGPDELAQACSVYSALHNKNHSAAVAGAVFRLPGRHAKVRRDGYRQGVSNLPAPFRRIAVD